MREYIKSDAMGMTDECIGTVVTIARKRKYDKIGNYSRTSRRIALAACRIKNSLEAVHANM